MKLCRYYKILASILTAVFLLPLPSLGDVREGSSLENDKDLDWSEKGNYAYGTGSDMERDWRARRQNDSTIARPPVVEQKLRIAPKERDSDRTAVIVRRTPPNRHLEPQSRLTAIPTTDPTAKGSVKVFYGEDMRESQ